MSFRLKTILGVAFIEAVLLSVLVYEAISLLYDSNARAIEYRAQESAEQFSAAIKDAFLSDDLATLETFTAQILESEGVVYARIMDHNSQTIAKSGMPEMLQRPFVADLSISDVNDGSYDVEAQINESGIVYGSIQLGISIENFESVLATAKQRTISIALVEMGLVAFFSFILGSYLTRQLQMLREGANRLSKGELGTLIDVTGKDEIAETAIAFNQMSSDLKQSHQQNTAQSELFKDLLETSSDFFWQTDEKLHIKYVSVDYIPTLGLDTQVLLGVTLWDFLDSTNFNSNMDIDRIKSLLADRKDFSNVELEINSGGDSKWFSLIGKPAFNDLQEFIEYRGTAKDITEFVVKEQELEKAKKLAEASDVAKSSFLATMSHELRTPLNGIMGLSSVLQETELDDDQKKLLGSISRSGEMLFKVLSDILDISKVEAGAVELVSEPFSLPTLVEEITALFIGTASANSNEIRYTIEPVRPLMLMGDLVRLKQIFANLIGNAVKFCSNGLIDVSARFESREGLETFLVVSIQDNGLGIAKEHQETIFDAFTQIDATTTRRFGGTGLGLNIVKKLVILMNGSIGLESEPGVGSKFWFEIPIQEVEDGPSSLT